MDEPDDARLVQLVRQPPPKSRVVSQWLPLIDARSAKITGTTLVG